MVMATPKPEAKPNGQPAQPRYAELVQHTVANAKSGIVGDLEQSAKSRIEYT